MATTDDEQRYGSLSRNELQDWCTKLGLPSMKSCRVMAESLRSYIKNHKEQRSKSAKISDGFSVLHFATTAQPETHVASSKTNKGCTNNEAIINLVASGGSICSVKIEPDHSSQDSLVSSQPVIESICESQNTNKKELESDCEVHMSSYAGTSHSIGTPISFEVYFSSFEGLDLSVDLNSKPSDWIKRSKDKVYMVRSGSHCKSGRFVRDLCESMDKHIEKKENKHEETSQKEETASNFGVRSAGTSKQTDKDTDARGNCSSIGSGEEVGANMRESSESSKIEKARRSNVVHGNVNEVLRKSKRIRSNLDQKNCILPRRSPRLLS